MSVITSAAWHALQDYRCAVTPVHLRDLFATDPARFSRFSIEVEDLLVDFSKQRIDAKAIQLFTALAEAADLANWRERLFASMSKNAVKASEFFQIPTNRVVELGTQVEL